MVRAVQILLYEFASRNGELRCAKTSPQLLSCEWRQPGIENGGSFAQRQKHENETRQTDASTTYILFPAVCWLNRATSCKQRWWL